MQAKILIVMAAAFVAALMCAGACFAEEAPRWAKEIGTRNRAAAAEAKFNELFKGGDGDFYKNGGELGEMATNFIYGDARRADRQTARAHHALRADGEPDARRAQGAGQGRRQRRADRRGDSGSHLPVRAIHRLLEGARGGGQDERGAPRKEGRAAEERRDGDGRR